MNTDREPNQRQGRLRAVLSRGLGFGLLLILLSGTLAFILRTAVVTASADEPVEPQAGAWPTWLLETSSELRPAAPPNRQATRAELERLQDLAQQRDAAALDQIAYWTTGAPVYRWNQLAIDTGLKNSTNIFSGGRGLALLHAAIYDATIATWEAKYAYDRPRPSEFRRSFTTVVPTPNSPSYPSEHAATAGAASEVLAYLFPEQAGYFREQAEAAGRAMLLAGVQFPSDVEAGLALGRQVAALAIERAMHDNSTAQWDGTLPTGPGYWTGQNPAFPVAGTWRTWALESGSEFRPAPPPAYDSPALAAELDELRSFTRTPRTNASVFFWEYGSGPARNHWFWNQQASQKLFEYGLSDNPPRAAQVYALESITFYDVLVACFDAKYAYWAPRPFQLDPEFQTVLPTPNHPSYPAAHACLSVAAAEALARLFPHDAEALRALGAQAGESRLWGGIHFRSDVEAGTALALAVTQKVFERAGVGGAQ